MKPNLDVVPAAVPSIPSVSLSSCEVGLGRRPSNFFSLSSCEARPRRRTGGRTFRVPAIFRFSLARHTLTISCLFDYPDLSVNRTNRTSILSGHSGDAIHPSHLGISARPSPKSFRLRVATLAPTPHHPKVVAQLKMPWPLPDVDILHGVARKRPAGAPLMNDETGPEGGLIVTAEELKDIVCTSAFWMIVRENFGGIQKKTRKGDGWNIRG